MSDYCRTQQLRCRKENCKNFVVKVYFLGEKGFQGHSSKHEMDMAENKGFTILTSLIFLNLTFS